MTEPNESQQKRKKKKKKKKNCRIEDFAVPADNRVKKKKAKGDINIKTLLEN